jgi:hypothetical protein
VRDVDPTAVEADIEKEWVHGMDLAAVDEAPVWIRERWRRSRSGCVCGGKKIPVGLGFKGAAVQLKRGIITTGNVGYVSMPVTIDE